MSERLNLPSASTFERTVHCPGWLAMSRCCPAEAPQAHTEHGSKVAEARAGAEIDDADVERDKQRLLLQERIVYTDWQVPDSAHFAREERYWLRDAALNPLVSAKVDHACWWNQRLCVVDDKAGWKPVTDAKANWQLRVAVVCMDHELGPFEIAYVAILHAREKRPTTAVYTRADIDEATAWVRLYASRAMQHGAPRVPGPWCDYCPAKAICPQAGAYAMVMRQTDVDERVATMTPESLLEIFKAKGTIEKILRAVVKRLEAMPAVELAKLGLEIAPGDNMTVVVDPAGLFQTILTETQASTPEVLAAVNFVKERVQKLVREKLSVTDVEAKRRTGAMFKQFSLLEPKKGSLALI